MTPGGDDQVPGYFTVAGRGEAELTEKRSRFLSAAVPASSADDAMAFIAEVRAAHKTASHNCWAYLLRGGGMRYSDDGEPQGTAGVPMLEVLKKNAAEDCAVVVTRYFGGTLLGAAGLVRAYSAAAKLAVDAAGIIEMRLFARFSLVMAYPLYGRCELLLRDLGARTVHIDFGAEVSLEAAVLSEDYPRLEKQLLEITAGTVAARPVCEEYLAMPRSPV